jgi:hypothetical protein
MNQTEKEKLRILYEKEIKKYFSFLIDRCSFRLNKIDIETFGAYIGLVHEKVGILIQVEFREAFVDILFFYHIGNGDNPLINNRYDLKNLGGKYFITSLANIMSKKKHSIPAVNLPITKLELLSEAAYNIEKYALEFVQGDETAYKEMDRWMRDKIEQENVNKNSHGAQGDGGNDNI